MMMQRMGAAFISVAVILVGFNKRAQLKTEIMQLREFEQALEQLKESVCYEKFPLKEALIQASNGKDPCVRRPLQKAAESLHMQSQDVKVLGHWLPMSSLRSAGQAQDRILTKLTEEVRSDRIRRENRLEERCRSCMSVAVAVSAICAIVLL